MMAQLNGIHRTVNTLQVSPSRLGHLQGYDSLEDLIGDHISYVNNWAGTPDFSFFNEAKEDIKDIDNYVLVEYKEGRYFIFKELE